MEWRQHIPNHGNPILTEALSARVNELIQAGRRTAANYYTDRVFGVNGFPLASSRRVPATKRPKLAAAPRDNVHATEEASRHHEPLEQQQLVREPEPAQILPTAPTPAPTPAPIPTSSQTGTLSMPPPPPPPPPPSAQTTGLDRPPSSSPPQSPPHNYDNVDDDDDGGGPTAAPEQQTMGTSSTSSMSSSQIPFQPMNTSTGSSSSSSPSSSSQAVALDPGTEFVPYDWYQLRDGFEILKLAMGNLNLPNVHCLLRTRDGFSATTHCPRGLVPRYDRFSKSGAGEKIYGAVVPIQSDPIGSVPFAQPAPTPASAPAPLAPVAPIAEQSLDLGDQRNVTQRVMFGFPSTLTVVHARQSQPVVNYRDPPYHITAGNVVAFTLDPTLYSAIRTIETVLQRGSTLHTLMDIVNMKPDKVTMANIARFISVQYQYIVAATASRKKVFASRIKELRDEVTMIHAYFRTIDVRDGHVVFHANDRASGMDVDSDVGRPIRQPWPLPNTMSSSDAKPEIPTEDELVEDPIGSALPGVVDSHLQ